MQVGAALLVGVVAAPRARRGATARVRIVDGLRARSRLDGRRRRWRIPFSYIVRNLAARKLTTALTAGGMALVVYVFATVLMLAAGLEQTLVATGPGRQRHRDPPRRADRGAKRRRPRARRAIVESLPDIAIGQDGEQLISKEPVVLINLPKRDSGKPSNVVIRGVDAGGSRAAAAGEARRGPDVPAGHLRDHRRDARSPAASRARASARRCASPRATGRSSACSTRAAPASTRRSGATPSRCCRRSAGSASRR